mgnify:FL=1
MKRKRHSPEQIIHALRPADAELAAGQPIAAICQKLGVAEATFHRWRNQYGGAPGKPHCERPLLKSSGTPSVPPAPTEPATRGRAGS